jgi:hypothetical protein
MLSGSSSSSSSGSGAYAQDAPQPVGLLCYPLYRASILDVPTFRRQSVASSVPPERSLAAKGGTIWARIMAGNFA